MPNTSLALAPTARPGTRTVGQLREAFSGHHDLAMAVRGLTRRSCLPRRGCFSGFCGDQGPDRAAAPCQKWTAEGRRFHGLEWVCPWPRWRKGCACLLAIDSAHHDDFMHDFRRTPVVVCCLCGADGGACWAGLPRAGLGATAGHARTGRRRHGAKPGPSPCRPGPYRPSWPTWPPP